MLITRTFGDRFAGNTVKVLIMELDRIFRRNARDKAVSGVRFCDYQSEGKKDGKHSVIHASGTRQPRQRVTGIPESGLRVLTDLEKPVPDTLDIVMNDFFAWRLKSSPEFSTGISYKYNDKLDPHGPDTFDSQLADAKGFLSRLNAVYRSSLTKEQQLSYDILKNILETFIDGYKWRNYGPLNPFQFLEGWQTDLTKLSTRMPLDTCGDFINYIRRIELIPKQWDEMMTTARLAIVTGNTNNIVSMDRIPGQIDAILKVTKPTESELYTVFEEKGAELFDENFRPVIQNKLIDAINAFNNKIREVKTFITDEYMPKARPGLGVDTLPDGKEYYRACLKWHTSIDISPEEVHEIGKAEVARIAQLIREAIKRIGFPVNWSISEVYTHMTNDPKFLLAEEEATLERFREIIFERIKPQISKYFCDIAELPLSVQKSTSDGVAAEYLLGTADGSRPGIFYANIHRPEDNPTFKMVSLSLHEAIPGHHLAESFCLVSDAPDFRKQMEWKSYNVPFFFPFYNAYVEGWALYAEYLGEEMGIYIDDYELLGRYSDEMLRACRLVVDTGIHYYSWTRQEAIDYLLKYTADTPEAAAIDIDRYVTWPGQACGYKIGEMKIKKLRTKAENQLGDAFDIRDFHFTILRNGPVPLDILENVVDEWIASKHRLVEIDNTCPHDATDFVTVILSDILCLAADLVDAGR